MRVVKDPPHPPSPSPDAEKYQAGLPLLQLLSAAVKKLGGKGAPLL